jgi:hypothetical protein
MFLEIDNNSAGKLMYGDDNIPSMVAIFKPSHNENEFFKEYLGNKKNNPIWVPQKLYLEKNKALSALYKSLPNNPYEDSPLEKIEYEQPIVGNPEQFSSGILDQFVQDEEVKSGVISFQQVQPKKTQNIEKNIDLYDKGIKIIRESIDSITTLARENDALKENLDKMLEQEGSPQKLEKEERKSLSPVSRLSSSDDETQFREASGKLQQNQQMNKEKTEKPRKRDMLLAGNVGGLFKRGFNKITGKDQVR